MLDTVENIKGRLGITTTQYDDFLTNQVELLSDVIEAYCRRKFITTDWEQTFYKGDYVPCKMLELYHFPVSTVASIVEDGVTVDDDEYRLHKPTGKIIRSSGVFFLAEETVITYTAGEEAAPRPVIAVLDALVQERYNKKVSGVDLNFGSDVQRVSIPGAIAIDFDYSLSNNDRKSAFGVILGNHVNVLDSYRSERAVLGTSHLEYVEEAP